MIRLPEYWTGRKDKAKNIAQLYSDFNKSSTVKAFIKTTKHSNLPRNPAYCKSGTSLEALNIEILKLNIFFIQKLA
jgi:hypothetical protein